MGRLEIAMPTSENFFYQILDYVCDFYFLFKLASANASETAIPMWGR